MVTAWLLEVKEELAHNSFCAPPFGVMVQRLQSSCTSCLGFGRPVKGCVDGAAAPVTVTDTLIDGGASTMLQGLCFHGRFVLGMDPTLRFWPLFPGDRSLLRVYHCALCYSLSGGTSSLADGSPNWYVLGCWWGCMLNREVRAMWVHDASAQYKGDSSRRYLRKMQCWYSWITGYQCLGFPSYWYVVWPSLVRCLTCLRCRTWGYWRLLGVKVHWDGLWLRLLWQWYPCLLLLRVPSWKCEPLWRLVRDIASRARCCTVACLIEAQNKHMLWCMEYCKPLVKLLLGMHTLDTRSRWRAFAQSNSAYLIEVFSGAWVNFMISELVSAIKPS